jgi:hypothetical protein
MGEIVPMGCKSIVVVPMELNRCAHAEETLFAQGGEEQSRRPPAGACGRRCQADRGLAGGRLLGDAAQL